MTKIAKKRFKTFIAVALVLLLVAGAAGCVEDLNKDKDGVSTPTSSEEGVKEDGTNSASEEPGSSIDPGEADYAEIYREVSPSVVSIQIYSEGELGTPVSAGGTGFVYDEKGHIITNNHVVENIVDSDGEVEVILKGGDELKAEIVGRSPYNDLAILKVDSSKNDLKPLQLGTSSSLIEGEKVAALGTPLGYRGTITHGIVSGLSRKMPVRQKFSIPQVIQIDVPVSKGNSGGPLVNLDGEVVGIVTAKANAENIGFAIPIDIAKRVIPVLIEKGGYSYPWIGINTLNVNEEMATEMGLEEPKGIEIVKVVPDSPAEKAGLKGATENVSSHGMDYPVGGDVVVGIEDREVETIDDLLSYLAVNAGVGDTVTLDIIRDGERKEVDLKLGERPSSMK